MNVNRLCGSGAQAIVSAFQALRFGDAEFALAGGAECMSRAPYALNAARFGQKAGDVAAVDMMVGALTCPFGTGHMGVTAENVATERDISRADQDAFALESQRRAAAAIETGRFASQIAPIEVKARPRRGGRSRPTSTPRPPRSTRSPSCAPRSRRTARSPRATPAASTTAPRPS